MSLDFERRGGFGGMDLVGVEGGAGGSNLYHWLSPSFTVPPPPPPHQAVVPLLFLLPPPPPSAEICSWTSAPREPSPSLQNVGAAVSRRSIPGAVVN